MLEMDCLTGDEKANEIIRKFINDRLIRMMEDIILDEVIMDMAFAEG